MATDTLSLSLEPRTVVGKEVKKLRREGIIPVAIMGKGVEPYAAQVNERDFLHVINKAGHTSLIELKMPGKKTQQAFLHEYQRNSLSSRIVHADFKVVDVNVAVTVDVPVVGVGENTLVERGQALLNHQLHSVQVHALPTAIPHQIEVDLSTLDFDKIVHVSDLALGEGVEVLLDPATPVFSLAHPSVTTDEGEGEGEAGEGAEDGAEAAADEE